MLAQQRRNLILKQLRQTGGARVSELTALLGVSDMTIRRDLERLESDGSLQKVHGGAVLGGGHVTYEPSFAAKRTVELSAKRAIAARAAEMVEPGTAIAVSAGTTTWQMALHVAMIPDLTIVTNSIPFAETIAELSDPVHQTVILTGGVRTPSAALVGPVADLSIRSVNVDHLFIGTYGFDAVRGLTSPNLVEADTNRALMSQARHVVVLADSTKWQHVGLATWGRLEDADLLISDNGLTLDARATLENAVPELILVTPDHS